MINLLKLSKQNLAPVLLMLLLLSCAKEESNSGEWLVPKDEVKDGGPGKDGIPALNNPELIPLSEVNYLNEDDLVIGYRVGDEIRAYPHKILDWHEIINDEVNGTPVAITYCPLTGTGIGWEREYNGSITTFGVSGLLYNTNLMPYDRTTNSTWSQMGLQSVNGSLIGTEANTFQIFETTWQTWKFFFPDSKIVSTNTGHNRNYLRYPYGDYRTDRGLIFSVSVNDERLPQKERVHGVVIDGNVKVYQFSNFNNGAVIHDTFQGQNIVLIGNELQNYIISFYPKTIDGILLEFEFNEELISGSNFVDQLGNKWDVFGHAVSGPNKGETLVMTQSFVGMWFSWAPFYDNPEIYQE